MTGLLPYKDVETVFRRLSDAMPSRSQRAKGPKGQPDAFRSCISCMLSAQSLDSKSRRPQCERCPVSDLCHYYAGQGDE